MIHNLDNSESIGPSSEWGNNRRKRGKLATVNENHARELELQYLLQQVTLKMM